MCELHFSHVMEAGRTDAHPHTRTLMNTFHVFPLLGRHLSQLCLMRHFTRSTLPVLISRLDCLMGVAVYLHAST